MKVLAKAWRGIALGVFLVSLGLILASGVRWQWIFVVMWGCGAVNAVLKRDWRWLPIPLLWVSGLSWSYTGHEPSGWAMFWILCGAWIIVQGLIGLIPRRKPKGPPHAAGGRVVLDAEMVSRSTPEEPR